jgi:hypothetical protein
MSEAMCPLSSVFCPQFLVLCSLAWGSRIVFEGGVIGDFVADHEREARFGQRVKRAGPRLERDLSSVGEVTKPVVKLTDGEAGMVVF